MADNKVNIVNGRVVPQFMGKPMQDAKPAKPEDNEVYALEKSIVTYTKVNEEVLEKQPEPMSGGVSSWNDLTDKPFYEEKAFEPIMWDGNTESLESVPIEEIDGAYYKVADYIPITDKFDIESMAIYNIEYGETASQSISEWERSYGRYIPFELNEHGWSAYGLVIASDGSFSCSRFPSIVFPAGIWLLCNSETYICGITAAIVVTPLEDKYLSKRVQLTSGLNVIVEESEDGTLTADKTYSEMSSVIEAGGRVTATIKHKNGAYACFNFHYLGGQLCEFSNIYLQYSMGYVTVYYLRCHESDEWMLQERTFALFDCRVE